MTRVPPLALCAAALGAQRLLLRGAAPSPGRLQRGAAVGVASVSVAALADPVARFRARSTTVDPRADAAPSALVTDGWNRVTRNPMYVGMAGILAAHAVWSGRPWTVLPVLGFLAWMDRVQVPGEEADLRRAFGATYDDYVARVPRWLGPVH